MIAAQSALLILAVAILGLAACSDLRNRLIPNRFAAALALCGFGLRLQDGTLTAACVFAAIVFSVTFVLWHRGMMGGGDVKLLSALTLAVPTAQVPDMLLFVTAVGAILAIVFLCGRFIPLGPLGAGRAAVAGNGGRFRPRRGEPIPYAVAIAIGGFITLAQGG